MYSVYISRVCTVWQRMVCKMRLSYSDETLKKRMRYASPVWPEFNQTVQTVGVFFWDVFLLHPSIRDLKNESSSEAMRDTFIIPLTKGKYLSMALMNRCLYCLGVTMVGSPLPAPPRKVDSFTQLSSFLSHV